jgi:3'-phosphoadenosine 5'-phosphosulfate sulfotransferase
MGNTFCCRCLVVGAYKFGSSLVKFQKVSSTKPKLKNVNFDEIDVPMEDTNQRFQVCIKHYQ